MFRCTECKAEYVVKPDYCDCGNDTFEEIQQQNQLQQDEQKSIEPQKNDIKEIKKEETQIPKKIVHTPKPFFDLPSTIIFSICIILSFVIVFFVGNPTDNPKTIKETKTANLQTNIPNINKLWDNTIPKNQTPKTNNIVPQVTPVAEMPKPTYEQYKPVVTQSRTPINATPTKKTTKPVSKNTQPKVPAVVPSTQNVQKAPSKNNQPVNPQNNKTQQVQSPQQSTQTISVNKQEIANYKIALRNTIASKINFVNVIGDGTCSVSFSISSNGTLQNKKFKQQSSNFTLNEAVHNAIMQITYFNPPPYGYNGEQMLLTVKMHNGNFEVTLY